MSSDGIKRSGIHISVDQETTNLLKQIRNLTQVSHSDILKLGCQAWLSLHGKGLLKGIYNELSTIENESVVCVLQDREQQRDEPANQP